MPKGRREVGLPDEPGAVFLVDRPFGRQKLQSVAPWQSRMLREINLAHPPRPEQAHDREPGEGRTVRQRHGPDRTHDVRSGETSNLQSFVIRMPRRWLG